MPVKDLKMPNSTEMNAKAREILAEYRVLGAVVIAMGEVQDGEANCHFGMTVDDQDDPKVMHEVLMGIADGLASLAERIRTGNIMKNKVTPS